jgi:hypothetical protein
MKDPIEVLRRKEVELARLKEEIEALRLVGRLLSDKKMTEETENRGKVLQMPGTHLA